MPASSPRAAFFRAFRGAIPFGMVVGPFGVLFGVLATEAGLSVFEVLSFSVIVIAGAAQMTALQLMQDNAPTVIVLAAALTVNLRMAMYSASLTPHLGALPVWKRAIVAYFTVDQSFAMSQQEFETKPQMTLEEKVAYFFGSVAPVCPIWYVGTWAGAALGTQIPESFALDFAVPITFIALGHTGLAHNRPCGRGGDIRDPCPAFGLYPLFAGAVCCRSRGDDGGRRGRAPDGGQAMNGIDKTTLWIVILGLGAGSFFLRFVFLGIVGNRALPGWVLRHLRYTSVAILPGLVAPMVVWPLRQVARWMHHV